MPDFARTDDHFVWLTLHGEIQDPEFLRFLEEIGEERTAAFMIEDFLVVDRVHREQSVPDHLRPRIEQLLDQGIIERVGRGRGTRLLLSRRFYRHMGKGGVYTRKRGLDRETNKALVMHHLRDCGEAGCPISELQQVLPAQTRDYLKRLLVELRREERVRLGGQKRAARWYAEKGR